MNMWPSQLNRNLSNCRRSGRKKVFRGFNGIRTRGLCVRAAVLYQLSYEDPYTGGRPIYWVHQPVKGMKHRMKYDVNCGNTNELNMWPSQLNWNFFSGFFATQNIGWKSSIFWAVNDKPWNFRNSKQKAGSSAIPLTAILERLEPFFGINRLSSASHRDRWPRKRSAFPFLLVGSEQEKSKVV